MNKENSIKCKNNKAIILGGGVQQKQKKKNKLLSCGNSKTKKTSLPIFFHRLLDNLQMCKQTVFCSHTIMHKEKKKGIICNKDCIIKHDTKSCKTSTKLNVSLTENHWQMQMVLKKLFFMDAFPNKYEMIQM